MVSRYARFRVLTIGTVAASNSPIDIWSALMTEGYPRVASEGQTPGMIAVCLPAVPDGTVRKILSTVRYVPDKGQ
ncbi:hypothetical protein GCM10010308_38200 [Streptomyces vinaceusdrappus]|nr:hypothetical protein GCM10010308_38200 [Streptomyces vinaceusdrappus]